MNNMKIYNNYNKMVIDAIMNDNPMLRYSTFTVDDQEWLYFLLDGYAAYIIPKHLFYVNIPINGRACETQVLNKLLYDFMYGYTDATRIGIRGYGVGGKMILLDDIYMIDNKKFKSFGKIEDCTIYRDTTNNNGLYYIKRGSELIGVIMGVRPNEKDGEQQ